MSTTTLQLMSANLTPEYRKKWNENMGDFFHLYKNGIKISDTLYRIGGIVFSKNSLKDDYFMLLKHKEAVYEDNITKNKNAKRHLASHWCIIDKNGVEKVVFERFKHPYLAGGQVYSLGNYFYNIETGALYCESYSYMKSEEFIFLDNKYDKDKSKRGILKINKTDGSFELFP